MGRPLTFVPMATPVVSEFLVFIPASVNVSGSAQWRLLAISRDSGQVAWSAPIPAPALDSQAGATLDHARGSLYIASGRRVTALNTANGQERWSFQVDSASGIVNATPAFTDDLGAANRLFITDYDGFGRSARLYALNIDPFDATLNPHQPGAVVWSVPIGGSSGNAPAYLPRRRGGLGLVYVSCARELGGTTQRGRVLAFDAHASSPPAPAWQTPNPSTLGFFGGVSVTGRGASGRSEVLAASYAFSGGRSSANILRLDAATGALLGTASTNRTSSTPQWLPEGRVALAGGLQGFGTVFTLSLFDASAAAGILPVWNSCDASWIDDGDSIPEVGEYLRLGGYLAQPIVGSMFGRSWALVPTMSPGSTPGAGLSLSLVDLSLPPSSAAFVASSTLLAGGSPAFAGHNVYAVGALPVGGTGLVAFGPSPSRLDVDTSSSANTDDLYTWEIGLGQRDLNEDGATTSTDRDFLRDALRRDEAPRLLEGRP